MTCKDVNVIFEVFEGILVIFHKRGRVENIWNWKGMMVFSNFQVILLKGRFGHLTCRDVKVIFEIFRAILSFSIRGLKLKIFGIGRV